MEMQNSFSRISSLLLIISLAMLQHSFAQNTKQSKDSAKAADVKLMIDEHRYIFKVLSVKPMKGGARQLTPGYILKVSKDTVTADLPYFGRLYQATIGSAEGGIKFLVCASIDIKTGDAVKSSTEILNRAGEACKKSGITFRLNDPSIHGCRDSERK